MANASETYSTLKFAQRAKLIKNNAVVNTDFEGNLVALQNEVRKLARELERYKMQEVESSRGLAD
jgi:kinesin family protein 15